MPNTKSLYQDLFNLSKEIELLIQLGNFEKIEAVLDKRESFVAQILPEDFLVAENKELIELIKILDEKNFAQIIEHKQSLGQKIGSLTKNMKCLALYKVNNTYHSSFIDQQS